MPRIKIISNVPMATHRVFGRRQLPAPGTHWENCEFVFDKDAEDYDYLVVYDAPLDFATRYTCPPENTVLIIPEPISLKLYSPFFTRQFAAVITPQEEFVCDHPRIIRSHPGIPWSYGWQGANLTEWMDDCMRFDDLAAMPPPAKTRGLSTVCSFKGAEVDVADYTHKHVFHVHRIEFTKALKRDLPDMAFYSREHNPIADKRVAIEDCKYHLAVENYDCDHWWTEKLADAYLGYALPFIHGCSNLADYFPRESYIPINIYDYAGSLRRIRQAMENNEYEKRLTAIIEARKRLLYEHNMFALLARVVRSLPPASGKPGGVLYCRGYHRANLPFRLFYRYHRKWQQRQTKRYLRQKIAGLKELPGRQNVPVAS